MMKAWSYLKLSVWTEQKQTCIFNTVWNMIALYIQYQSNSTYTNSFS